MRQAKVEVQDDRHALIRGEPRKCPSKVFALEPGFLRVQLCPRAAQVGKADHGPPASAPPLAALVVYDSQEPRSERPSVVDIADAPPRQLARFLNGVLGLERVVQQGASEPQRFGEVWSKEVSKGDVIALLGALDSRGLPVCACPVVQFS